MSDDFARDCILQAMADLTPNVSDHVGDTDGFAVEQWVATTNEAEWGAEVAGHLINGYRQLALKLVVELARRSGVSPMEVMAGVGRWTIQTEGL